MSSSHCKNCEADLDGAFCRNCGQKADVHAISFSYLTHDTVHALTHTDKGFLLLIKDLVLKPGIVAKEYIDGKRKKYFNPLSFFVITSALEAYFLIQTGYFSVSGSSNTSGRQMPPWMMDAFKYSIAHGRLLQFLLIIPLLALLTWLFFRKPKRNLAELSVLFAFIVGESNVIRLLIFVPWFVLAPQQGALNKGIFEILLLIYVIVALKQFFNQNLAVTIIKSIFVLLLMIVFYWLLTALAALVTQVIFH